MINQMSDSGKYNFYQRLNQIGEYKYNNRMDTLFMFQLSFIMLLVFIILFYLSSIGVISTIAMWIVLFLFGSIVLLVFLSRTIVLPKLRDKNEWNRMNYGDGTIPPSDYVTAGVGGGITGEAPTVEVKVCVPHAATPEVKCPP